MFIERFVPARCIACWQTAPPMPAGPAGASSGTAFVLDWVVPDATVSEGVLGRAALAEAVDRAATVSEPLRNDETLTRTEPLPARTSLHVEASNGPAVNGYIGLRFGARYESERRLPPDLRGYLALVEPMPPGSDGSAVERRVVRAIVGPLFVDSLSTGLAVTHLRAVRLPTTSRPENLTAAAWLETAHGRVLAVSAGPDAACPPGP
jgi:hypothetical protein